MNGDRSRTKEREKKGREGYVRRKGGKERKREDNMCSAPGRLFR